MHAAGAKPANAARLTIYTTQIERFSEINQVYAELFADSDPPARAAVGVAGLPKGAVIEVDAIVPLSG